MSWLQIRLSGSYPDSFLLHSSCYEVSNVPWSASRLPTFRFSPYKSIASWSVFFLFGKPQRKRTKRTGLSTAFGMLSQLFCAAIKSYIGLIVVVAEWPYRFSFWSSGKSPIFVLYCCVALNCCRFIVKGQTSNCTRFLCHAEWNEGPSGKGPDFSNPQAIKIIENMRQRCPPQGESHFLLTFWWRLNKK